MAYDLAKDKEKSKSFNSQKSTGSKTLDRYGNTSKDIIASFKIIKTYLAKKVDNKPEGQFNVSRNLAVWLLNIARSLSNPASNYTALYELASKENFNDIDTTKFTLKNVKTDLSELIKNLKTQSSNSTLGRITKKKNEDSRRTKEEMKRGSVLIKDLITSLKQLTPGFGPLANGMFKRIVNLVNQVKPSNTSSKDETKKTKKVAKKLKKTNKTTSAKDETKKSEEVESKLKETDATTSAKDETKKSEEVESKLKETDEPKSDSDKNKALFTTRLQTLIDYMKNGLGKNADTEIKMLKDLNISSEAENFKTLLAASRIAAVGHVLKYAEMKGISTHDESTDFFPSINDFPDTTATYDDLITANFIDLYKTFLYKAFDCFHDKNVTDLIKTINEYLEYFELYADTFIFNEYISTSTKNDFLFTVKKLSDNIDVSKFTT